MTARNSSAFSHAKKPWNFTPWSAFSTGTDAGTLASTAKIASA
jgi:hypothetical protein